MRGYEIQLNLSQKMYLMPDRAMREARKIGDEFGLRNIGVEVIPLRWNSTDHLLAIQQETGVRTGVAGVTTETYGDFARDLWDFKTNPKVVKELLMNIAAIGAQSEPSFTRNFGNHLQLAVALGSSYLAMHEEPTRYLVEQGKFPEWTSTHVLYGRKLGWGPQDNRPQILSWDIFAIRDFIQEWQEKGSNIGAILPADTALRTGLSLPDEIKRYNLMSAWLLLQPRVIQIGDYDPNGKKEKLRPGSGRFEYDLATLVQESSRVAPHTIFTIEVESPEDVRPTIDFVLTNWRGT